ncbi:hypothetical protein BJ508DRAFT_326847 [Ascobolus immersus RN42]|uniref:C2H2-type domain-containing protein n=1 Tax=Ascobolus immersus RN42 TaxID=1160509 RepID=A0A3N4I6B9_ASCIM|nr:hypothetical protein BJ508DRAFT_326847 [Ascobolus immersus RN42]
MSLRISARCRETIETFNAQLRNSTENEALRHALEDARTRFSVWTGNVGAFAPNNANIDHRLRDNHDVATVLLEMLNRLKDDLESLTDGHLLPVLEESEPEEDSDEEGARDCSHDEATDVYNPDDDYAEVESVNSSASSGLKPSSSNAASTKSNISPEQAHEDEFSETLASINSVLDRLFRFAAVLRSRTSSSENARVRSFMERRARDKTEDDLDFEESTRLFLFELPFFENAPRKLKERLYETMVLRRMTLLYRQRHQAKLKQDQRQILPSSTPLEESYTSAEFCGEDIVDAADYLLTRPGLETLPTNQMVAPTRDVTIRPTYANSEGYKLSETNASSINIKMLNRYETASVSNYSVITRDGATRRSQLDIPRAPKSQALNDGRIECPYCFQFIKAEETKEPRWSRHLLKDISPYVCIFTECGQGNDTLFRTPEEWHCHLQEHCTFWRCPNPEHEDFSYDSKLGLKHHFLSDHAGEFTESQASQLVDICVLYSGDPFEVIGGVFQIDGKDCPLCTMFSYESEDESIVDEQSPQTKLLNHILMHLERLALRCLPVAGQEEDASNSELKGCSQSDGSGDYQHPQYQIRRLSLDSNTADRSEFLGEDKEVALLQEYQKDQLQLPELTDTAEAEHARIWQDIHDMLDRKFNSGVEGDGALQKFAFRSGEFGNRKSDDAFGSHKDLEQDGETKHLSELRKDKQGAPFPGMSPVALVEVESADLFQSKQDLLFQQKADQDDIQTWHTEGTGCKKQTHYSGDSRREYPQDTSGDKVKYQADKLAPPELSHEAKVEHPSWIQDVQDMQHGRQRVVYEDEVADNGNLDLQSRLGGDVSESSNADRTFETTALLLQRLRLLIEAAEYSSKNFQRTSNAERGLHEFYLEIYYEGFILKKTLESVFRSIPGIDNERRDRIIACDDVSWWLDEDVIGSLKSIFPANSLQTFLLGMETLNSLFIKMMENGIARASDLNKVLSFLAW